MSRGGYHTFRYSLPAEILAHGSLLIMAVTGGLMSSGMFYAALSRQGENTEWFLVVGAIGLYGLALAIAEAAFGLRWGRRRLLEIAFLRMWANVLGIVAWTYMAHTIIDGGMAARTPAILMSAALNGAFHLWAALMCKRTFAILSPTMDTAPLEARLDAERLSRN